MTAYNVRTWGLISLALFAAALLVPGIGKLIIVLFFVAWVLGTLATLLCADDIAELINEIRSVEWED